MEFYKTQGSIIALKEKSSIDINELFGLIICVVSDCYKSLGVKDVSGMRAGDPKQMVLGLNSIASMLLKASDENAETIEELKTAIREKINKTKALLQDANKQFSEISDSIGEQQSQEIALRDKLAGLENKKLEYERYADECGKLQAIIDELSDENIEKIRNNMEKMEENVQERRKLRDELDLKIQEQSLLLNEQEKATAEKSSKLKEIQKRVSEAKKEVEKIASENESLVKEEAKLKAEKETYLSNIENLTEQVRILNEQCDELKAEFTEFERIRAGVAEDGYVNIEDFTDKIRSQTDAANELIKWCDDTVSVLLTDIGTLQDKIEKKRKSGLAI